MEEETVATPQQPQKPRQKVLLMGIGLLLIITLVGAGIFLRQRAADAQQKAESEPKVKAVLHLEQFIVNLADAERDRYLRVGIELGLDHSVGKENPKDGEASTNALIRDTILAVLSAQKSDDLLSAGGKEKLKGALVQKLHERIPMLGAKEIYFTDFLVQF